MARVGKYYGVRPGDAIKFWWMDATFAVERRIDKLHRDRVHRAAGVDEATEEVNETSVNNEAAATTATETTTQEAPATTDKKEKKPGFFSSIFGKKKDKKEKVTEATEEPVAEESEEAVAASQMAPEEEPGAEKMDKKDKKKKKDPSEPIVGDIDTAAQQANQRPVEGFNIGGAQFDLNMGPVERVEPSLIQNNAGEGQNNIFQQAVHVQPQPQVMYNPAMAPNGPIQMNVPPMAGPQIPGQQPFVQQPTYQQQAAQQNPAFSQQPPLHRVDAPPKVIQPKPPRAEADQVEVSDTNVAQAFVDPNKRNKVVRDQHPDLIQKDTPHIADKPSEQLYDNRDLITAYPYLGEIQNIALKHHIQLKMQHLGYAANPMIQTGMILCYAFNEGSNTFNEYKSFTIDTGVIIDRRPKLFKGIVMNGFEDMQAYAIQLNDKTNKNKVNFNAELFEKIFVGGIAMLDDKGMYSPQYRALNKFVDLSTMPTKLMNGERRKAVQDRLMKAMNAGVFEKALREYAPNSRFEFKENSYNKDRGTFILTNYGVPIAFNGPVANTIPVEITFGSKVFIHSPSNPPAEDADTSAPTSVKETTTKQEAEAPKQEKKQKSGGSKKSTKKQQEEPKAEAAAPAEEASATASDAAVTSEN